MDFRQVKNDLVGEALRAAEPLRSRGYEVIGHRVDESFGSGWVLLTKNDVRLRILNDRGEWFVEIGSSLGPEEWFEARLVLSEIGASQAGAGTDHSALIVLCEQLGETAPRWELLFLSSMFATARRSLRSKEIASAKERFGLTSDEL